MTLPATTAQSPSPSGEPVALNRPDLAPAVGGSDRRTVRPTSSRHWLRDRLAALTRGRGLVGIITIGLIVGLGVFAPVLAPYGPGEQIPGANLVGPSADHWLGTDAVNQDLLSRTLYGIRVDLLIIAIAVPIGASIGTLLGLASALWTRVDGPVQRAFDLLLAFPTVLLGIALAMVLGPGFVTVVTVVALTEIPIFGRLIRTTALRVRELPYVEAARVSGAGKAWILRRHILPNALDPVFVQLGLAMSIAVFVEGAMSFLGLGVVPPDPSLGSLINEGAAYAYHAPLFAVGPLVVVIALTLGLLLLSQAASRSAELPASRSA